MKKLIVLLCAACALAQAPAAKPAASSFPLTVDSIMRGPDLVGYPPSDLRWSGDSRELFFEWRMAKEDQPATWKVGRDGGAPQRLTEAERRMAPLVNGQWDAKRRRILGVDRGDIVIIDTVAHKRIDVTHTTGNESSPRWAQNETRVTFIRDNNLFIVPASADGETAVITQLTDVSTRRTDPRSSDSQKYLKEEEPKILDWVEQEAARRKRREDLDKARALPKFEIAERQTIADAALSADGKFAYLVVNDRAQSRAGSVTHFVS